MNNSIQDMITHIEEKTGSLNQAQRALLITDGSVTSLLEIFCKSPVGIRTISQQVIPAPDEIAHELDIAPGEEVNYRVVDLYNKKTQDRLIHAISYAPLSHLPPAAIVRLMKEDEPIGHIMRDEMMESRREICSIKHVDIKSQNNSNPAALKERSGISRKYRIIHNKHPIFLIEEIMPIDLFSDVRSVRIKTPSRLHIGLLDMNGSSGRVDGGAGITLNDPGFDIIVSESDSLSVVAPEPEFARYVNTLIEKFRNNGLHIPPVRIEINQAIPFHCGLGSGTQLSLALASGIEGLSRNCMNKNDLISLTGRGGTSGIGIRAFFDGGLIVDAGHRFGPGKSKSSFAPSSVSSSAGISPLVGRYEIPDSWNIILAIPNNHQNIHGEAEQEIFHKCCPVPVEDVRIQSHLVLMKLIPALLEEDIDEFGDAINQFQDYGFKKCELEFQPDEIRTVIDSMRDAGAAGAGMSSFGPVVYGICDTNSSDIISAVEKVMNEYSGGRTILTKGRNQGASISIK